MTVTKRELPRRFHLYRKEDVSGISGPGVIAEGTQFSNGQCIMLWLTHLPPVTTFPNVSILEQIHSHGGATLVIWDDPPHEPAKKDNINSLIDE